MEKKRSRTKSQKIAYWIVLISFAAPLLYYLIQMVLGVFDTVNLLTMLQCTLGLFVLHVPEFLSEKLRFEIPSLLYVFYLVFLYCAIFLGEFYDMFNRVPFWDVILHCSSSLVTGFLGFMFVAILNKSEKVMFRLSPLFVSLFAFCFAVMIGALWEIYEYIFDGLLGLNMQKFTTPDGTVLSGHAALVDTMEDLMIDAFGGFVASVIGYLSLKHNKEWLVPKLLNSDQKNGTNSTGTVTNGQEDETSCQKSSILLSGSSQSAETCPEAQSSGQNENPLQAEISGGTPAKR